MLISEVIQKMLEVRDRRAELAAEEKTLVEEWERLEALLIQDLDGQGMTRASSALGTAVISELTVPLVEDWDAALAYMRDNDMLYLLQRRIATGAFREIVEGGGGVPGVKPVPKRSISLRST